jgi:hypothetical protein
MVLLKLAGAEEQRHAPSPLTAAAFYLLAPAPRSLIARSPAARRMGGAALCLSHREALTWRQVET